MKTSRRENRNEISDVCLLKLNLERKPQTEDRLKKYCIEPFALRNLRGFAKLK